VQRQVRLADLVAEFDLDDNTRWRLLEGLDHIDLTLTHIDAIADYEHRRHSGLPSTTGLAC